MHSVETPTITYIVLLFRSPVSPIISFSEEVYYKSRFVKGMIRLNI